MKFWLFLIVCIGMVLSGMFWPGYQAQAATYFFTAEYLGGGNCGVNRYLLPTNYSWNLPASGTVLTIKGSYTIQGRPTTSFAGDNFNLVTQTGKWHSIEVLPSDATTNGLDTYSYTEIDEVSAGGMALGGQIIKVVCKAGLLVSASVENFYPKETVKPTALPTFVPPQ